MMENTDPTEDDIKAIKFLSEKDYSDEQERTTIAFLFGKYIAR